MQIGKRKKQKEKKKKDSVRKKMFPYALEASVQHSPQGALKQRPHCLPSILSSPSGSPSSHCFSVLVNRGADSIPHTREAIWP